jgi:hypothetical protein
MPAVPAGQYAQGHGFIKKRASGAAPAAQPKAAPSQARTTTYPTTT